MHLLNHLQLGLHNWLLVGLCSITGLLFGAGLVDDSIAIDNQAGAKVLGTKLWGHGCRFILHKLLFRLVKVLANGGRLLRLLV